MKKNYRTRKRIKKSFWTLKRKVSLGVLLVLSVSVIVFLMTPTGQKVKQQGEEILVVMQEKAHLKLDQVSVEGRNRTSTEDINKALDVWQGMPIMDIDLEKQKEALLALPWVRDVLIERHLPNQILIRITEKEPIAIWQNHKKYLPIDEKGEPIADDKTVISNVLLVVGEDAPKYTPLLIEELAKYPSIAKRVLSAVRVGKRRWDLYLNDVEKGVVVRLPETGIDNALLRLKDFHETGQILERDIQIIDLKLPDRLIIRSEAQVEMQHKNVKKKK
ncbi:MAG: FtsQ-type POTRA domain-containing protein [Alphaproteobacteria bacterium]|nr:FtsQ-type POTRA domain-containing protein [Alphaproteobacteria bacterium]